jgi:tRNA(Ile)-lysidine synthase
VLATLRERELLSGATRVLVACSGGPDSQVLLHVLQALRAEHGCELLAASVDHGLRADAQRDVATAAALAQALDVQFLPLRVEVAAGASRQAQARAARYAALLDCAHAQGATRVAVGHTLDDQAETVLARILRGTGLLGLGAIAPRRADGVVRPLIDAPRALVRRYAQEQALMYVEDPSNSDPRYLRTRIRQALLPWLLAENPHACEALAHLADDARDAAEPLLRDADALLARAHDANETEAPGSVLASATPAEQRRVLKRWVERDLGLELRRRHVVALQRMLQVGGEVRLPKGITATLDRAGRLTFATVSKRSRGAPRPSGEHERGA